MIDIGASLSRLGEKIKRVLALATIAVTLAVVIFGTYYLGNVRFCY